MVRKVIPSRVRKHNALKVRSQNRFLLRKRAAIVGATEKKRQSKVQLDAKEIALLKKTLTPLIPAKPVKSTLKEGRSCVHFGDLRRSADRSIVKVRTCLPFESGGFANFISDSNSDHSTSNQILIRFLSPSSASPSPPQRPPGIEPGRVVILLGGAHRGKHAVILKVLDSGLLLVTGPHKVNGLPLRRVHQKFTIVTSTKLDLSSVNVPSEINDSYFKRPVEKKVRGAKAAEGEASIFAKRRVDYQLTDKRKQDQVAVDKQVLEVIKKHPEKSILVPYLASHFYLKNKQYPHKMKF